MKLRPSARLLIINPDDKLLLFRFEFERGALSGRNYWATPGGGLEAGETFKEAAQRELEEETGLTIDVGDEVGRHDPIFQVPSGEYVRADERYYLVHAQNDNISLSGQSSLEREYMKQHHWWSSEELIETDETIYPENLLELLKNIPSS